MFQVLVSTAEVISPLRTRGQFFIHYRENLKGKRPEPTKGAKLKKLCFCFRQLFVFRLYPKFATITFPVSVDANYALEGKVITFAPK